MDALTLLAAPAPVEEPDDRARIIAAAKAGNLDAFEELMRQYERMVLTTALRMLGSLPDAQDAAQDVFLKLYRNLSKGESLCNIAGWLYRVTVNACHDVRRRRPSVLPMESAGEPVS